MTENRTKESSETKKCFIGTKKTNTSRKKSDAIKISSTDENGKPTCTSKNGSREWESVCRNENGFEIVEE